MGGSREPGRLQSRGETISAILNMNMHKDGQRTVARATEAAVSRAQR
jgi:hypothetical protein